MSPVHQPRTFVMALNTSAGDRSTVKDVLKFVLGMTFTPSM
jgi:hypothetical protein